MAVVSIHETAKAARCSVTADEVTYEAPYRVKVSLATDGPGIINQWLRAGNGPWSGSTYDYGGDSDPAATLREWSQWQREPGSDTVWTATARYSTKQDAGQVRPSNDTGELTDFPPDWRPVVDVSWAGHEEPCYKAVYRSGFTHDPPLFVAGQSYAPQNSALEIFDPPLMKDRSRATYQCKLWREIYNSQQAGQMIDLVNKTPCKWRSGMNIIGGFAPYTLKVADVRGVNKRDSREVKIPGTSTKQRVFLEYYEITIELQWRRDGWREKIVDQGFRRIVNAGDDDGHGGTVSLTDLLNGKMAPNRAIEGLDGIVPKTPVLLNGAGVPKQQTDRTPVEITWSKYDEESFNIDQYLIFFLEPS